MKKLIISLGIFISFLLCQSLVAASSATTTTAMECERVSSEISLPRPEFGENLTIIVPGAKIASNDALINILRAMVAQNNNFILVHRTVLEVVAQSTQVNRYKESLALLSNVRKYIDQFDRTIDTATVIKSIVERFNNEQHAIKPESPIEDNENFDLYALAQVIFEEGSWAIYEVDDYCLLVPLCHFSQSNVAKRTRYSIFEALQKKGVNIQGLKNISSRKSLLFSREIKENSDSLQEVVQKIVMPKSKDTFPLVVVMFGHGDEKGIMYQMKTPIFVEFLKSLNNRNIGALAYLSCYSGGENLAPIEGIICDYEILTVIVPGPNCACLYLNSFLLPPYAENDLSKSLYNNQYGYTLNQSNLFAQIFDRIKSGDSSIVPDALTHEFLSRNLSNICGRKMPGVNKFVLPSHALLTPLGHKNGLGARTSRTPNKIFVPEESYIGIKLVLEPVTSSIIPKHEKQLFSFIDMSNCLFHQVIEKFKKISGKQQVVIQSLLFKKSDSEIYEMNDVLIQAQLSTKGVEHFYFKNNEIIYKIKMQCLGEKYILDNEVIDLEEKNDYIASVINVKRSTLPQQPTRRKLF